MQQSQTGRVIFIVFVFLAALGGIFQRQVVNLFKPVPWSQKMMLRPGIDMVGGTSLLYQIKDPVGGYHSPDGHSMAEDVMAALKRRVDPDGVKNYIWRPQGENRLEIQIPASSKNEEAIAARDAYVAAQKRLDAFNIRPQEVITAVEQLKGPEQAAKLAELAQGVPGRTKLFDQLTQKFVEMQAAHEKQQADLEARASLDYDKLKAQIDATNVKSNQLEIALEKPADARAKALADMKAASAGLPDRIKAIDQFVSAYDAYHSLKGAIDDAGELKRDLQGSGVLEFHIAVSNPEAELPPGEYRRMEAQLAKMGPRPQAGDQVAWFQVDRPDNYKSWSKTFNDKQYTLCWITPDKTMANGPGMPRWTMENARKQNEEGADVVALKLDVTGGKLFHDLTGPNVKKPLAAILDHRIISVATIQGALGSDFVITGDFSEEELRYMITTFNAGSLPAQLEDEPISEHTVGPSLGEANLRQGLHACEFGLVIVAIFLICYYYLAGVVATFAVLMNIVLILGVLAAFGATFTLPGIAGIVLTIGAAVDANVLIFERLREEQHAGLGLRMAMRNAYEHAQSAIWDSNATTIITSLILMWLGSEEVKGFGTTLLIGLISSLFTSLFVTRTIFNILIDTFNVKTLSSFPLTFPKWDRALKPDIDWMKLVPALWVLSIVLIGSGIFAFVEKAREHELADVDFTSGTQVQFDLVQPMSLDEMRKTFATANKPELPSMNITAIGSDSKIPDTGYELVTANADAKAVRSAVLSVLGARIHTDLPSKFDHVADAVDVAVTAGVVQPVNPGYSAKGLNDFKTPAADDYIGGVAIELKNIDPPLKPDQIRDRLDRQRATQSSGNGVDPNSPVLSEYTVVSPLGPGVVTSSALVLASDPAFPYDKDPGKWTTNVANPIWELVKDGVNHEGRLQKVNTFGPQVAGDNQQAAFFALILSSLVIMAYIWLRFGNLKYGTATVLAMIHDVALVVGAVGLSHYIVHIKWLADILMVEPFRVNLTIVAAVLTVMSYSMIDTIVVFDRIRENRGKFGYLTKKIVNDSINQTLSRTLLTAGTTIMTVAGMYVVGGPGIHGFTFVLLVGILVGTYSSIAIAAPFLLIGVESPKEARSKPPRPPTSGQLVPA